jgi:hypothetical protein
MYSIKVKRHSAPLTLSWDELNVLLKHHAGFVSRVRGGPEAIARIQELSTIRDAMHLSKESEGADTTEAYAFEG